MKSAFTSSSMILSWVILIGGAVIFVTIAPFALLLVLMPFWKPDEVSFLSMVFTAIPLVMSVLVFWTMSRAYKSIRNQRQIMEHYENTMAEEIEPILLEKEPENNKPVWPWLVIIPSILLLISMGPGVVMLPVMPLFLAGMSTDSGQTPDYVPMLIILIGYGLLAGSGFLFFKAIRVLRRGKR